jgi:hypothetical protein
MQTWVPWARLKPTISVFKAAKTHCALRPRGHCDRHYYYYYYYYYYTNYINCFGFLLCSWILFLFNSPSGSQVEVEVTLRPTVSRPVRLGVLPLLDEVTRCYIYLSDNYFLYFSCRGPSLTRGGVCNLQCNDASSISSYIATDSLSSSSSWCRILISLFDSYFVFSV